AMGPAKARSRRKSPCEWDWASEPAAVPHRGFLCPNYLLPGRQNHAANFPLSAFPSTSSGSAPPGLAGPPFALEGVASDLGAASEQPQLLRLPLSSAFRCRRFHPLLDFRPDISDAVDLV